MTNNRDTGTFAKDEDGAILVFWAMALAVVLGMVALSFDIGRVAATQSELQAYADHVALAAAGELDGRPDSIIRARNAATNLIADSQTFGLGAQALTSADFTLDFFAALPGNDTTPLPPAPNPNPPAPRNAIYARVTLEPKTVPYTFGAALQVLTGSARVDPNVGATAVAGFTQYACDITPMMFCIPGPTFDASDPATIGDMIRLRSGGQGAAWGPGNFGFLEPSTLALDSTGNCAGAGGTGPMLRCVLGAVGSITQCFAQRGVDTEPGQKVGITNAALNTRFDMWTGAMKNEMNNPVFAPAPNVIKGLETSGGNSCNWNNPQPTTDTLAIPRDDCFPGCAPYGDGTWSTGRAAYVTKNYGGTDPHPGATTRYEYYLAEIASAGGAGSSSSILTGLSETGRPMCSPNQAPDPERRVIIAAGIDCAANPISGSAQAVPVHQFVKMFITEPVVDNGGSVSSLDIYAEIIGSAGGNGGSGGSAGIIHDVVQLYR
ncbi:pilus assembly protein TadG-related protein [Defluviimonas sp. SAOS-178_SWC]|uniref:pilus assembly protein TadG-related protein n=1 Tax=Defluviimonas sp. SAOS-178_SWC TaxID=3121287 RepID=UPI0032215D24